MARLGVVLRTLLLTVLALGCGTAPSVDRDQLVIPSGHGIVLGRFGVPPGMEAGATSRQMRVQNLGSKQSSALPFREGDTDDEGRSAPFIAELPAGTYQVVDWELSFMNLELSQELGLTTFEVVPGQVTCVGGLYPVRGQRTWSSSAHIAAMKMQLLSQDDCASLFKYLAEVAPRLQAKREVRLAVHPLCKGCVPEETTFLSVDEAEALRKASGQPLPVAWPPDPTLIEARIQLQVCVTAAGLPENVVVLKSGHPQLDSQLVTAANTWQFTPYLRFDKPTPFCYRPEFTLLRK